MNLHIAINDRFVIQFIRRISKIDSDNNLFLLYGSEIIQEDLDFDRNVFFFYSLKLPETDEFFRRHMFSIENIYIHYLSLDVVSFLNKYQLNHKITWLFWGSDGYQLYGVRRLKTISNYGFLEFIKSLKFNILGPRNKEIRQFTKKINFFAHYLHEDVALINKSLKIKMQHIEFSYASFNSCLYDCNSNNKSKILIGNSGDSTNNHFAILNKFLPSKLDFDLLCPLSYGGLISEVEKVVGLGKRKYGEKFIPIKEKLSFNDYNSSVLCKVRAAIFYHEVPQAFGNILQLLYSGSRIYMHPKSNLFLYLERMGFIVFPLNKRLTNSCLKELDPHSMEKNKTLCLHFCDETKINEMYMNLLSLNVRN